MTGRGEKETLKEIYNLLKDSVLSFTRDNDQVMNANDRMKDTITKTARQLKSTSIGYTGHPRTLSVGSKPVSKEVSKIQDVNKMLEERHLSVSRKLAKTENDLSKVNDKLQQLEKSLVSILDCKSSDNTVLNLLMEVRSSVNKCRQVQTHSDGLVEKLSDGIQQLLNNQQNVTQGNVQEVQIPAELNLYCTKMQAQGQNFQVLGKALNIEESILQNINECYGDDEEGEKFHQVIREWVKKPKVVNIRDFLGACHIASGSTGKDKPLAPKEKEKLLHHVAYLCDNMLDVPLVLPHLVTKSVISPRLTEYVLAPSGRIERILRLVDILCTKESGFEEFCNALKHSDQAYIAENMNKGATVVPWCSKRSASFSCEGEERKEDLQSTMSEDVMAPDLIILKKIVLLLQQHGQM